MKRPIDRKHATRWLMIFSLLSIVLSIIFFAQGIISGGIALLSLAIILLFPKIKILLEKNKQNKDYSIDKITMDKLESIAEEEIKKPLDKED